MRRKVVSAELKKELEKARLELEADCLEKCAPWRGYTVYKPVYKGEVPIIGLPYVVLVTEKEVKISDVEESFAYLDECRE